MEVFYYPDREIVIEADFSDIGDDDLDVLVDEFRERIKDIMIDGVLTLVRRYRSDGSNVLRCIRLLPIDERFDSEAINELFRNRRGSAIRDALEERFPELNGKLEDLTQTAAKALIDEFGKTCKQERREADLPTGIPNSIVGLLPDPLYIPAVRDLSDDIKTTDSAPFGRILSILRPEIESQLGEVEELFSNLNAKLNRVTQGGSTTDNRVPEIRDVEALLESFVSEDFPGVSLQLQIPPPEMRTILSSTKIVINDGVEGEVETKGDGLKRSVTFAILRAYVELSGASNATRREKHIFLFEEPELYLHPTSQLILYENLRLISRDHQVVVSTHSPLFLNEGLEGTFIKLRKSQSSETSEPPFSEAAIINLDDIAPKNQFQLICFDNNNAALFAETVLLVEGDSDHICFSYIPSVLNPNWKFSENKTMVVKVYGKSSFTRYRQFFDRFGVRVCIIADLDSVIDGFESLGLPPEVNEVRSKLIQEIDRLAEGEGRGEDLHENRKSVRNEILKENPSILKGKRELFYRARKHDVHILEKGAIEDYYPASVVGQDKLSKALSFHSNVDTAEQLNELCEQIPVDGEPEAVSEFELMFRGIFPESA